MTFASTYSRLILSGLLGLTGLALLAGAGLAPTPALAQVGNASQCEPDSGLVPECGCYSGGEFVPCTLDHLIELVNNVIQWLIWFAIPVAAVLFAYAGWLYLSAGGNQNKITQAHQIFSTVAVGFILLLSAWLVVYMLVTALVTDEEKQKEILRFFEDPDTSVQSGQ